MQTRERGPTSALAEIVFGFTFALFTIRFGPGGDQEKINAICILALNMINDKVRKLYKYMVIHPFFHYRYLP